MLIHPRRLEYRQRGPRHEVVVADHVNDALVTLFDKHSGELLRLAELPAVFLSPNLMVVTDKRIAELIEVIE
ncbi:hypothetical protein [Rhizobium ecuadorense]|uniref:hypothetical protein n=1 Tax=Rhizobium ecuadorense TaxID=1671795 RepID=UPI00128F271A|nr:hypothetical protein [Rhizobium ecuadorense]